MPTGTYAASGEADRQLCLHEIIRNWASRTPDAVAVVYAGSSLTYDELDRRANQLARRLMHHDIGVGSLVGVSMKRSLEMIVGLLAILKAGAAYVPLDPRLPRERLRYLIGDAALRVVLTRGTRPDAGDAAIIDLIQPDATGAPDDAFASGVTNDDLVYVIYTSAPPANRRA